ncbi:MAG TPA: sarcosine oxidase subunit gamma family protein [Casimicrobiaceae bacterium]|nr:sarcosine oxidase subunit gamma family protein [Casimicrobiaceae bacterium]
MRGDPRDRAFADAVARVLGAPLPTIPNTFAEGEGATLCWLSPDAWLVMMRRERLSGAIGALRQAFHATFATATDVSGGQTVLVLSGEHARDVLASGCPLDLRSHAVGTRWCAQSRIAKAPVLIRQADDLPTFEIVVRRSFADYLSTWLRDAAANALPLVDRA